MDPITKKVPYARTLTDEEVHLLSEIFRIIVKEVSGPEDYHNLAPGELGIDYVNGTLCIRNPHTGNLFYPNSFPQLRPMLEHLDINNMLNSNFINDMAIYNDISQLPDMVPQMTPDAIITHMTYLPSMFVGAIKSDDPSWPSNDGILTVIRFSDDTVYCRFYDVIEGAEYQGHYDSDRELFIDWVKIDYLGRYCTSLYTDHVDLIVSGTIQDLYAVHVFLPNGLAANSTVTINGGSPLPIVDINGQPIQTSIDANNCIMLMYDGLNADWIYISSGESATMASVDILRRRISYLTESTTTTADNQSNSRNVRAVNTGSAVDWASVNNTPTTLTGYGITDAAGIELVQSLQNRIEELEETVRRLSENLNMK